MQTRWIILPLLQSVPKLPLCSRSPASFSQGTTLKVAKIMHFPLQQKLFQLALPDFWIVGPLSNILVGCNQQMSQMFHLALLGGLEFTFLLDTAAFNWLCSFWAGKWVVMNMIVPWITGYVPFFSLCKPPSKLNLSTGHKYSSTSIRGSIGSIEVLSM